MDSSHVLVDILILLSAALFLGGLCERFRQSAIIGYLLAGMLLGPNVLYWVGSHGEVEGLAELGVSLLLFSIGLEFSLRRLRDLGLIAPLGGMLQVVATAALATLAAELFGLPATTAIALGIIIAPSSTVCVIRVLNGRAELESVHGRNAFGILLLQDMAVVPVILLIETLAFEGSSGAAVSRLLKTLLGAVALTGIFYLIFNYVVPRLFGSNVMARNRELPILLAFVTAIGSTWAAHEAGISPALGAFLAGMLMAESPFATQIRADVASLRTALVTLFFSAVGMLGDPVWIVQHIGTVALLVTAIVFGKALIIWLVTLPFKQTHAHAMATGICLAQVGEFSFVLAQIAKGSILNDFYFQLVVSVTIVTLIVTPYQVASATLLGIAFQNRIDRWMQRRSHKSHHAASATQGSPVLIVGFGPAGQEIAAALVPHTQEVSVLELNPRTANRAREFNFHIHIGDATQMDVLEHARVGDTLFAIVTLPDPQTVRTVIQNIRILAPQAFIIARARYHIKRWEIEQAGADAIIDEESQVGQRLADEVIQRWMGHIQNQSSPLNS